MPLIAAGLTLAVVLVAFATQLLPGLVRSTHEPAGTPVPFGTAAAANLTLAPGSTACEPGIAIDPAAATATISISPTGSAPTSPLRLTLSGRAYRAAATVGAQRAATAITVSIAPPQHALVGTACLRNAGRHTVVVFGSGDPRVLARTRATVDGQQRASAFILTFAERRARSAIAALPDVIHRAATLSAAGPWLYWLLLPLVALGVPLAIAGALLLSLRDRSAGPDAD